MITVDYLPEKLKVPLHLGQVSNNKRSTKDEVEDLEAYLQKWMNGVLALWKNSDRLDLEQVISSVKELETKIGRSFVMKMLKETLGNRKEAAERLNISVRTLRYLLKEKGADPKA
nr:helix-turn-helix domain-containing protein [Geobacillus kaustophilus]